MLKSLLIKNFALIDSLEIEFSRGLNIITGETGAGKSVIVEALLMALGERASADLIREGEKKAVIEGVFNLPNKSSINILLEENQIDLNDELLIRRELSDKGNSRCFINDSPVNLALLKKIGDMLVDFHGQHDHQLLLNRETHIILLDLVADIENIKDEYLILFNSLNENIHHLRELRKNESLLKTKEESLRFELNEIEKINPKPDEENLLEQELNLIINFDDEINELEKVIINLKKQAGEKASKLSEMRKNTSLKLDKSVVQTLKTVGIENSVFRTVISNTELENDSSTSLRETEVSVITNGKAYIAKPDGIDDVEFFISTNKGETPKPLANIASGGEISRVMLALKSIVADSDKLPILVFDEIDIGISGRIAQKVGTTMKELSSNHQIIAITHLPQIAALGDRNIRVEKSTKQGRTLINCKLISEKEKVEEIAKLLSGEKITDTSLKTASELINFKF